MTQKSLQDRYSPNGVCFGCGPSNAAGLRIKSFVSGDQVVATWRAAPHHQAFPGMLNGGIIGTLLDCHCNWTACHRLMLAHGTDSPPCTVTAEYTIKLRRPTPIDAELALKARAMTWSEDRVTVEGELAVNDRVCASCRGVFVAVREGHPAYHAW